MRRVLKKELIDHLSWKVETESAVSLIIFESPFDSQEGDRWIVVANLSCVTVGEMLSSLDGALNVSTLATISVKTRPFELQAHYMCIDAGGQLVGVSRSYKIDLNAQSLSLDHFAWIFLAIGSNLKDLST